MNYRLLPIDEWEKVKPLFNGHPLPSADAASIAVAEEGGEVKGLLVIQLALHMEPLVIVDSHVNFKRLVGTLEAAIEEAFPPGVQYFSFAPDEKVGRMCEINDMIKTPYSVYSKVIGE